MSIGTTVSNEPAASTFRIENKSSTFRYSYIPNYMA